MAANDLRLGTLLAAYAGCRWRSLRLTDRSRLRRWQQRRLRAVLARARRIFPFYRRLDDGSFDELPVVDKATFLEHFAELNVAGADLATCRASAREAEAERTFDVFWPGPEGPLSVGLSSGTSGRQGVFLASPRERAHWAGVLLAKALPGALGRALFAASGGGERIALFLRAGGPLYDTLSTGRTRFRYFDLHQPFDQLLADAERFDPTVLAAPPQVLRLLSAALDTGQVRLAPRRVVSVAEVLDDHDREVIEASFGQRLHQIYQATEGFLGATCSLGTLHLNEDLLLVEKEWIDEQKRRFVPVVTDLFRRSQAILRYRLDDVLVAAEQPCPCGSPLLAVDRVEGRFDDLLIVPGPDGRDVPLFADFVRRAVLGAADEIEDFRCVQPDRSTLWVDLRLDPALDPASDSGESERIWSSVRTALGALVEQVAQGGSDALRIERRDLFGDPRWNPLDPGVKVRRVRRGFALDPSSLLRPADDESPARRR